MQSDAVGRELRKAKALWRLLTEDVSGLLIRFQLCGADKSSWMRNLHVLFLFFHQRQIAMISWWWLYQLPCSEEILGLNPAWDQLSQTPPLCVDYHTLRLEFYDYPNFNRWKKGESIYNSNFFTSRPMSSTEYAHNYLIQESSKYFKQSACHIVDWYGKSLLLLLSDL